MRVGDCVRALPLPTPSQSDEKSLQSTVLRIAGFADAFPLSKAN